MIPSSGSIRSPLPESKKVALRVHHDQHRFEPAQEAIRAPVLRELDRRAFEIPARLFQLGLEAREQRERIGRRAGKAGEDPIVVEPADFPGGLFHDRVAKGDLAVAGHDRLVPPCARPAPSSREPSIRVIKAVAVVSPVPVTDRQGDGNWKLQTGDWDLFPRGDPGWPRICDRLKGSGTR